MLRLREYGLPGGSVSVPRSARISSGGSEST